MVFAVRSVLTHAVVSIAVFVAIPAWAQPPPTVRVGVAVLQANIKDFPTTDDSGGRPG